MKDVFVVADNIISPVGRTTDENFQCLTNGQTGVQQQNRPSIAGHSFYASLFGKSHGMPAEKATYYTSFEQLLIDSITDALSRTSIDLSDKRTVLVLSTTKGNIDLIEDAEITAGLKDRIALHTSARLVAEYFQCANKPLVVSSACISGSLAILIAGRMIGSGQYDYAVVAGADIISKFVFSGFQSFQALSPGPCKPFDAARDGINLGEGAATIILSSHENLSTGIKFTAGAVSNDANHISGPSRTGQELCQAIKKALEDAGLTEKDIDLISAHGTATLYNDEMESLAISLANLQEIPVNSLKGYFGHTLGAAGLIESIVSIQSLKRNLILPSLGYERSGVTKPLNVSTSLQEAPLKHCLKTASGFGGCNAAIIFSKI